jgi:FKBP-type peptidyl-prolyl cis-trans isomerase FklB
MKLSSTALALSVILMTGCESTPPSRARETAIPPPPAPIPLTDSALSSVPPAPATTTDASGVTTTPSGLRYRVLASGPADGKSPSFFDSVMVHYRGTLTDGTVFDSSYERGSPATFGVGQVIPGWTEALKLMKPGDKWMLHIPSRLAYGGRAVGDKIPPNSDLIFQVELLQVFSGL